MSNGSSTKPRIKDDEGRYLDPNGEVIDAPVLDDYERRLTDAHNRADADAIAEVQSEYNKARDKAVQRMHDRAARKARDDS